MENNIDHLCPAEPFSGTLPHDLGLVWTENGSIPEEPLLTAKELGDSSYESADDVPNGSADIKFDPSADAPVAETSRKGAEAVFRSEKLSRLWKILIYFSVSVIFLMVAAAALYGDMFDSVFSCVWPYFTSENYTVPSVVVQNVSDVSNSSV